MLEMLKSKGIICFFIFIIAMGIISSNSLSSMQNNNIGNESFNNEIMK